jgi:GxxExxY protein
MSEILSNEREFKYTALTEKIIGIFYEVYNELGHGFLELVYENAMTIALSQAGLSVVQQHDVQVVFRGQIVGEFQADLIVEGTVLIELKAARAIDVAHEAQVLNYLRATRIEVGLLLNFGPKPQVKRFAFDNTRKTGAAIGH